MTGVFDLEGFVENPNHQHLIIIRKVDWASIAHHYGIPITTTLRKEQLKNVVVEALVDSGILSEEAIQTLTPAGFPPQQPRQEIVLPTQAAGPVVTLDAEKLFELERIKLQMQADKELRLANRSRRKENPGRIANQTK